MSEVHYIQKSQLFFLRLKCQRVTVGVRGRGWKEKQPDPEHSRSKLLNLSSSPTQYNLVALVELRSRHCGKAIAIHHV